jgi:hypothetical protein
MFKMLDLHIKVLFNIQLQPSNLGEQAKCVIRSIHIEIKHAIHTDAITCTQSHTNKFT